jgi:hypothetical protein
LAKKKARSVSFGTSFKRLMAKLLAFAGAIWHPFHEGWKYGTNKQKQNDKQETIDKNQALIERNQEVIAGASALLEKAKRHADEVEKTREYHNTPDPLEAICEMDFFIGDNRPVRVQMSYAYWCSLQDSHPLGWSNVIRFVDDEIERRKNEDD